MATKHLNENYLLKNQSSKYLIKTFTLTKWMSEEIYMYSFKEPKLNENTTTTLIKAAIINWVEYNNNNNRPLIRKKRRSDDDDDDDEIVEERNNSFIVCINFCMCFFLRLFRDVRKTN